MDAAYCDGLDYESTKKINSVMVDIQLEIMIAITAEVEVVVNFNSGKYYWS